MKKFNIILVALLFVTVGNPVLAKKRQKTELQKQKAEIKAWKKRKAAMQPLQLKDLVEENHRLQTSNHKLTEEVKASREELEQLIKLKTHTDSQNNERKEHDRASSQLDSYDFLAQGLTGPHGFSNHDWAVDKEGKFYIKGLVFKVQIGAYKKRDLSNVIESKKPQGVFEQEQSEGINMYTLGHFRNYWKANQFKKKLRAMGLKDAWIVPFKDGKRVLLKDVLQEVIKQKK